MHDSSSRHAAPSGPTLPVWVTGRADSGPGVREARPQGGFFFSPRKPLLAWRPRRRFKVAVCGAFTSHSAREQLGVSAACLYLQESAVEPRTCGGAAGFEHKRSALHSKVCWVLLSFQLSLTFAVTGTFCFFAITPPMTFLK